MIFKKAVAVFIIFAFFLSGCATKGKTNSTVGPPPSSSFLEPERVESVRATPIIDVIIPVFDPGLPEDPSDYDDENIWPELRRAEANRFAYIKAMRTQLQLTEVYGLSESVTTESGLSADLFQAVLSLELMSIFFQIEYL